MAVIVGLRRTCLVLLLATIAAAAPLGAEADTASTEPSPPSIAIASCPMNAEGDDFNAGVDLESRQEAEAELDEVLLREGLPAEGKVLSPLLADRCLDAEPVRHQAVGAICIDGSQTLLRLHTNGREGLVVQNCMSYGLVRQVEDVLGHALAKP